MVRKHISGVWRVIKSMDPDAKRSRQFLGGVSQP